MVYCAGRLGRWVLVALAAQQSLCAASDEASDDRVVRLGVKRMPRNAEVERLIAGYHSSRADPSPDATAFQRLLHSLAASVRGHVPWTHDEPPATMTLSAAVAPPSSLEAVETQIRTGEGSHTITVLVGGQERELIIDTGSGKTAFICEGCDACGHRHTHAPFRHTNNTKFITCDPEHRGDPEMGGCMECVGAKCRYGQKYVEGDNWEAFKMSDEMSFPAHGAVLPSMSATVEFGCIYAQTGCFNAQTSDGIMGFSRHPDAIYEQFFRQRTTHSRLFAQCLADDGGALSIGGVDMHLNRGPVMYTPLRNTGYQYWTVNLETISVGDVPLELSSVVYNADRGCVLDSGTTFVYLPTTVKSAFVAAWRKARGGSDEDLPLSDSYHHIGDSVLPLLPPICFHFANDARICMKPETYMYRMASNEYVGTIFFGDDARSTIIGASALLHHNIIYDVDNNRVGMAEADCDAAATTSDLAAERMIALELHPGGDKFRAALDNEYWLHVALIAVTAVAMVGLVVTVWEEVHRTKSVAKVDQASRDVKCPATVPAAATPMVGAHEAEDGGFAFFLMEEDE